MRILKFGGTSVATPERIRVVADIVRSVRQEGPVAVVVSALGGVTETLLDMASVAARGSDGYREAFALLERRHLAAVDALASAAEQRAVCERVLQSFEDLRNLFQGVSLLKECSPRTLDSISSYGERLSVEIVAAALRHLGVEAEACDARALIVTDDNFGQARVEVEESYRRLRERLQREPIQIVTGFVSATRGGETTTLGRGGSDYTAALLGAAVSAERVEIWTDVDGVMSADPRIVPGAFSLERLSYEELMELSHFGARVVYPPSVHPAREAGVPLLIKNSLRPEFPGTLILDKVPASRYPVRGISSIHQVALLRLEGDGMVGVPGIAMRLFASLAREKISVILISQASSEHSICVAVDPDSVKAARRTVGEEFELERAAGLVDDLTIEENLSVVAVVGEAMRERTGIAGRIFRVLGEHRVNVRAIAQGSSELNISLVIGSADEKRAVRAIHDAFFLPGRRAVDLYLVGTGKVGGSLVEILEEQERSGQERLTDIRLVGLSNSRKMLLGSDAISVSSCLQDLEASSEPADLEALVDLALAGGGARTVVVDCTAGDEVPAHYVRLLAGGVAVVTANKRPLAGSLDSYEDLLDAAKEGSTTLAYETTVGAALPVVRSVHELVRSGDRVHRIEGLLSGTLGFLCDRLGQGVAFSEAVREAHRLGFTEPDPREDLGGLDVARKLLILCREAGWCLEPEDLEVEPMLPGPDWLEMSIEQFWEELPSLDEHFETLREAAAQRGESLCFLADSGLDGDHPRVGLESLAADHVCAKARGSDNLVAISTGVYVDSPLVISGPGAGPRVTASGVLADVILAARS